MKPSPLQLDWVTYPEVSFKTQASYDGEMFAVIPADVEATVNYKSSGSHLGHLELKNRAGSTSPYEFSITVLAQFSFDLETAQQAYKPKNVAIFSEVVATNICRILYSSAREMLALVTSRAPYQTAVLDSVLLEPSDVTIRSDVEPELILMKFFGASHDDLEVAEQLVSTSKDRPKVKKDRKSKQEPG